MRKNKEAKMVKQAFMKLDKKAKNPINSQGLVEIRKRESISADDFIIGAIKEMHDLSYMIVKKETQALLNELFDCFNIEQAKERATNFAKSLVCDYCEDDVYKNSYVKSFFNDAPIYKLLFIDKEKNKNFQLLKKSIYDNGSRNQKILFSMMNMSYFENIKSDAEAFDYINTTLEESNFEELNESYDFDALIMSCIREEQKINKEYNLNINIGGMRILTMQINESKLNPEKKNK